MTKRKGIPEKLFLGWTVDIADTNDNINKYVRFDPNTIKSKDQKKTPIAENDSIGTAKNVLFGRLHQ